MEIQHIGQYLRTYRKQHKKTLQHVGDAIGATSSYISQLEKGVRHPSDEALENILTKAFGISSNDAETIIRKWRIKQYQSDKIVKAAADADITHLPFYRNITDNLEFAEPDELRPFYVEDKSLLDRLFLWEMIDNSMEPLIPNGALLVVDKDISDLSYRSLILTLIGQKATVRFYEKHSERIKLIPSNNQYPVYFGQDIPIYGKVKQMLVNL